MKLEEFSEGMESRTWLKRNVSLSAPTSPAAICSQLFIPPPLCTLLKVILDAIFSALASQPFTRLALCMRSWISRELLKQCHHSYRLFL